MKNHFFFILHPLSFILTLGENMDVRGVGGGAKFDQIAPTVSCVLATALVVMSIFLISGVPFGHQGKFFIMAGCFLVGSIPFFCYTAYKKQICNNHLKTT